MSVNIENDPVTGTDTTGHEWDGIRELNTPLPKWWLYTWIATIIWAGIWCVLYPSVPFGPGYWHGVLHTSNRVAVDKDVHDVATQRSGVMGAIATASFDQIRANPTLMAAAQTAGRITFANNCQACHGAGGGGRIGYPALAAGAWLWGGKLEDIQQTVTFGIRNGLEQGRDSQMPHFGSDALLQPAEIQKVADYVMTLYRTPTPGADVAAGRELFAANCSACHGEAGQGSRLVGAPALASQVHLYGASRQAVVQQITQPHMGVMPNWNTRLDAATIKSVAIYVHDLGGGE